MSAPIDRKGTAELTGLFVATILAWAGLEGWFIAGGRATISARVRSLYRTNPDTGVLAALCAGLAISHFWFADLGRD